MYKVRTSAGNFPIKEKRSRKRHMDNLDVDALAATKAGMSYGKYKALPPARQAALRSMVAAATPAKEEKPANEEKTAPAPMPKPFTPKGPPQVRECVCPICGTPFTTMKKNQKYCSDKCRGKHSSRAYRARQAAMEGTA